MGMGSDISYQNRINLAQQEISVIRKTIDSQKYIIRRLVQAQIDCTQTNNHVQSSSDAVRIAYIEPARERRETRNVYNDDNNPEGDAQQDYKDFSRLSPTDPRGLRILLLRECAYMLRGAAQDFEEYEFQAGSLEQMVRALLHNPWAITDSASRT